MSSPEVNEKRPVWEGRSQSDEQASFTWVAWVLVGLKWVALAYLALGGLMILGLVLALIGVFETTLEAGQMLGFGMGSFFVGGVLILLLSINEKLDHFTGKSER